MPSQFSRISFPLVCFLCPDFYWLFKIPILFPNWKMPSQFSRISFPLVCFLCPDFYWLFKIPILFPNWKMPSQFSRISFPLVCFLCPDFYWLFKIPILFPNWKMPSQFSKFPLVTVQMGTLYTWKPFCHILKMLNVITKYILKHSSYKSMMKWSLDSNTNLN